MSPSRALRLLAVALLFVVAPLEAQDPVVLSRRGAVPTVTAHGLLADEALENAVISGLPVRIGFQVQLWRDELVDDLVDQTAWSAVIAFEPLEARFLAGILPGDSLGLYPTWDAARAAVEGPFVPATRRPTAGRFYYIAAVEVETLSLSDLDELERWLRGELEPAVRGRQSVGGALGTGLKRLLIRILGLPARRYEVRTEPFDVR